MSTKTSLVVRGVFSGRHMWPGGAQAGYPEFAELHPHYFHFEVLVHVTKSREIEFQELSHRVSVAMDNWLYRHRGASCEDMAEYILHDLINNDVQAYSVEVNEDGYSGARVELVE